MEEEVKTQSRVVVGVITPAKHDKTDAEQNDKKVIPFKAKKLKTLFDFIKNDISEKVAKNILDIKFSNVFVFDNLESEEEKTLLLYYDCFTAFFDTVPNQISDVFDEPREQWLDYIMKLFSGFKYLQKEELKKLIASYKQFMTRRLLAFDAVEGINVDGMINDKVENYLCMQPGLYSTCIALLQKNFSVNSRKELADIANRDYLQDIKDYERFKEDFLQEILKLQDKVKAKDVAEKAFDEANRVMQNACDDVCKKYNIYVSCYADAEQEKHRKIENLNKKLDSIKVKTEEEVKEEKKECEEKIKNMQMSYVKLNYKTIRSGRFAIENRARASFTNEHQSPNCQEAGDE